MVTFRQGGPSGMASRSSADYTAQIVQQLRTAEPRIPPYPAVAGALDKLRRDGASMHEVASIVASDASLAAAVLRRASAAAVRIPGVITLESAIMRLGIEEITQIVLSTGFGATAMKPGPLAVLRRDYWRRSVLSATFCKELAAKRGVDPDQAFLAGLLHDFGAVVVMTCIEASGHVPAMPEESWRRLVEELHVEIGMIVAARWKLPEQIADAITYHVTTMSAPRTSRALVDLVALVDEVNDVLERSVDGEMALAKVAGLSAEERAKIAAAMPRVAEQMAAFEPPSQSHTGPISSVDRETVLIEGGWPVDFVIEGREKAQFQATALGPNLVTFSSDVPFPPAWLADLALHCEGGPLKLLCNVKTCDQMVDGTFMVTAQPFGLGGDEKKMWMALVSRTRRGATA